MQTENQNSVDKVVQYPKPSRKKNINQREESCVVKINIGVGSSEKKEGRQQEYDASPMS